MKVLSAARVLGTAGLWIASAAGRAALGADSEQVIATDRPAVTESSVVVPEGSIQLENGFLATDTEGHQIIDLPETNLRLGVLPKTELRFTAPDYYRDLSAGGSASGFADSAIGIKQQLGPMRGLDVSIIPSITLPTGAQPVSNHGYDPALQVPWSAGPAPNWTIAGQLASYWPRSDGRRNRTAEATLLVDRQLSASWDAFMEYAGDFPERGGSNQLLHVGAACKLSAHQQLDIHAGAGLSHAAPRSFAGLGYSLLLPAW